MKKIFIITYVLFLSNCKKTDIENPNCQEKTPNSSVACAKIYDPVCGCNNKTYGNTCEANAVGITNYTKGECK